MTSAILSALNILTKPLGDGSVHNAQSSHQEALVVVLRANRALLLEQLHSDSSFQEVRKLREEVMADADWFSSDTEDSVWAFVQECLLLFLALAQHLSDELKIFEKMPPPSAVKQRTAEMAPPLPPDVLSVAQQKTLGAALQFVVSLGLCPYLAPGVGVPLGCRSAFWATVEKLVCTGTVVVRRRRLLTTTKVLLKLAELSALATLVFTRHLGDVMAALCHLGYQPQRAEGGGTEKDKVQDLSAEEGQMCKKALKSLLGKVYQPIVIKELLILQGGPTQSAAVGSSAGSSSRAARGSAPAWLRRLCGQLLSERLMQPNGVQAVVRAILGGGTGGESDWKKCECVARILRTCPQQSVSADCYYRQVCPQILELLHFKDKLTALQFQRVATRALLSMVQEKPSFAQEYLLSPLLAPLHRCTTASGEGCSQTAVEEWELTRCVDDVYKIWVVGNSPSASLLKALEEVLPVIFTLFCFTKQNVSHLRAPCQEILLWYLSHTEPSVALPALKQLSGLQGGKKNEVAADFRFNPGSDGGVRLCSRESCSDEDDALYEKLSGEQWRLECLMQLLAELKDSDLPGDFFLDLLHELTSWAAADDDHKDEEELDVSAMTLLEVEQQLLDRAESRGQRLALLQVLAVMVESVEHTVLLRKNTQVVHFLVSLLQRACVGLYHTTGPGLENPVESETLSMGIGLVATLLSGPQLSAEDYSSMSRLLPPLETLSQKHSDVFIRELASNLRAVIATHGAYRPENLPAAAQSPRNPEAIVKNNSVPCRKKPKTRTEANKAQTSPNSSPADVNSKSIMPITPPASSGGSTAGGSPKSEERTTSTSELRPPTKSFSDCLLEACDPDVPTRAFALRVLTQMVQKKNPDAVQGKENVLMLFLENVEHEDSFVYLSAIQGLAALADSYPERILERLLKDFQHGPSLPTSNKERSLETRLKVGEVLMRASRAMGELAPHLGRPLLGVFLQGTRDPDQSVRASSLSNLGELCQRLDYSLGPLAQELSSCLTALIKTEKEAEVRRAAIHVITLLLRGLSDKTTQVLRDVLLDLYRALKWVVRSDPDDVSVLHAQLALEELDDVMRRYIFPEQKLEKKIVVLP
ncbi:transport and Golgi organization protein 6 homolog [Tautogolabrus adspersus]